MDLHEMNIDQYLTHKGTSREELKDDAETLAGHFNDLNKAKSDYIASELANKASKDDVIELQKGFNAMRDEQMKTLNDALKAQGLQIQKLTGGNQVTDKSLPSLSAQLNANLDALKTLKGGSRSEAQGVSIEMVMKVPATMTSANISGGNVPVEDRLEGFNIVPSRAVRLLDIVQSRGTNSNLVSWTYQANKDGATGQTAEGVVKNQIDFDIVVASENLKKTTAFIKVSTEMLDDIAWLRGEINNELLREILKQVEAQTYEGDNTGENHNGIRTVAPAFAAGAFALAIDNANNVDVLAVAANQIKVAQEGNIGNADLTIMMHPTDVTALKFEKVTATDKRYVERVLNIAGSLSMDGIPIIETTLVTVGEYLIGDFMKAMSVSKDAGIRLEIGLDVDDFTKNLRTILAEWRGLTIVKNNDRSAFVAGVFATDKAALETA